jgi:hypothetical protein
MKAMILFFVTILLTSCEVSPGTRDAGDAGDADDSVGAGDVTCPWTCDVTGGSTCCLCPGPNGVAGCCTGVKPAGMYDGTCCGKPCSLY